MRKVDVLRKKYPKFVYEGHSCKISGRDLKISFDFKIEPDIFFKPKITIKNIDKKQLAKMGPPASLREQARLRSVAGGDRGKLLWPFRVALSGKKASAGPFEIAEILGKEKVLKRTKEAKERA